MNYNTLSDLFKGIYDAKNNEKIKGDKICL
jgi:hypothetical protein